MSMRFIVALITSFFFLSGSAYADEIKPALLQLTETKPQLFEVLWKVPARGDNARLLLDVQFDDRVTNRSETHSAFVRGAHLQSWMIYREGGLPGMSISIDGLAKASVEALLRIQFLDGRLLVARLTPELPHYRVVDEPALTHVMTTYSMLGLQHILEGVDHLLFVMALVLLVKGVRNLVWTITAFTIAHSITLSLSALEVIHIPVPPVEACIALSIVFVATEIIRSQQGNPGLAQRKPWIVAFTFGLLHGLGFAAALGEIGLPQADIPAALLFFNLGVEAGQLVFVATILLTMVAIKRLRLEWLVQSRRWSAYLIGSMAAFWTVERTVSFWV